MRGGVGGERGAHAARCRNGASTRHLASCCSHVHTWHVAWASPWPCPARGPLCELRDHTGVQACAQHLSVPCAALARTHSPRPTLRPLGHPRPLAPRCRHQPPQGQGDRSLHPHARPAPAGVRPTLPARPASRGAHRNGAGTGLAGAARGCGGRGGVGRSSHAHARCSGKARVP